VRFSRKNSCDERGTRLRTPSSQKIDTKGEHANLMLSGEKRAVPKGDGVLWKDTCWPGCLVVAERGTGRPGCAVRQGGEEGLVHDLKREVDTVLSAGHRYEDHNEKRSSRREGEKPALRAGKKRMDPGAPKRDRTAAVQNRSKKGQLAACTKKAGGSGPGEERNRGLREGPTHPFGTPLREGRLAP